MINLAEQHATMICVNTLIRKNEAEWYSQKSHQKHKDDDTTKWSELRSEVKELAILEKEEIKKINTHRTQIEKDYSDSIWIVLNLNVN
jgi:hypothetical protein